MSNECIKCGHVNEDEDKFCVNCGTKLIKLDALIDGNAVECYFCGHKNPGDSRFCVRCGTRIHHELPYENDLEEVYRKHKDFVKYRGRAYNNLFRNPNPNENERLLRQAYSLSNSGKINEEYPKEYNMECPNCHNNSFSAVDGEIKIKGINLSHKVKTGNFRCDACGLEINLHPNYKDEIRIPGRRYSIVNMNDKKNRIWKRYANVPLYKYELDRIFNNGLSDDDIDMVSIIQASYNRKTLKIFHRFEIYLSERFTDEILSEKENSLKPVDTTFVLDDDEEAYFIFNDINYSKPMVDYSTSSSSQGTSNSTSYGQSFNNAYSFMDGRSFNSTTVGYYATSTFGSAVSYETVKVVDNGVLILTNKRIIFSGSKHSMEISIDKVMNMVHELGAIMLHVKGRSNIVRFSNLDSNMLYFKVSGKEHDLKLSGYLMRTLIIKFMSSKKKMNLLKSVE